MDVKLGPDTSPDARPTADVRELFERAAERGYVLLSELVELYDPLTHASDWVDTAAQRARELHLQVVDDLTEDEDRPDLVVATGSADSTRQYLNEIGRTPLLRAQDEVDLAKRYQAGIAATAMLGAAGGRPSGKKGAMLRRLQIDGERAKQHMIQANLRLVVSVAARYRGRGVDLLALIQEGNVGLIRGVEKFDHTKGYKFSTYATWWIRQALQRGVANTGRVVRLPVHVHEQMGKIRWAQVELLQQLGREPTDTEIAEEMGMELTRLRELRLAAREIASLDRPVGEDGSATMGDLVADTHAPDPEGMATATMARDEIIRALAVLDDRERAVLMMRYGLVDGEQRTLEDIGIEFGLTRERIRQIEKKTLTKLRHPSRSMGLRDLIGAVEAGTSS
jgi:RNA polymerase sigma factor (sigma-70 family)